MGCRVATVPLDWFVREHITGMTELVDVTARRTLKPPKVCAHTGEPFKLNSAETRTVVGGS